MKKYVLAMLLVVPSFSCAMNNVDPLAGAIYVGVHPQPDGAFSAVARFPSVKYSVYKKPNGKFREDVQCVNEVFQFSIKIISQDVITALKQKIAECEFGQQNNE